MAEISVVLNIGGDKWVKLGGLNLSNEFMPSSTSLKWTGGGVGYKNRHYPFLCPRYN